MRLWKSLVFIPAMVALLAGPAPVRVEASLRRDRAAERVAGGLKALGLRATIQRSSRLVRVVLEKGAAQAGKGEDVRNLVWGRDIEALGFSADGDFRNKPLAFVGYGLQIPGGYDDLAGLDLKDHVAVIARTVPDLPAFDPLGWEGRSLAARLKRLAAAKVEAVVVLEDGPLHPPLPEEGPAGLDIPVLAMPLAGLDAECGDLGARLRTIRETGRPQSRDFIYAPWSTLSVAVELRRIKAKVPSVVAVLPGRDPKVRREFIAVAVPLGRQVGPAARGEVHPVSGRALLLEMARELKQARPRRSILFLALGAGAEGLPGSQPWIRQCVPPRASLAFAVHFDPAGPPDPKAPGLRLDALGVPQTLVAAVEKLAPASFALTVAADAATDATGPGGTSRAKIPTLCFRGFPGEDGRHPATAGLAAFGRAVLLRLADGDRTPGFEGGAVQAPLRGGR